MDCFRYLEMRRLRVLESFLKFPPNLPNSGPPNSESKEGFCNYLCNVIESGPMLNMAAPAKNDQNSTLIDEIS